MVSEAKLWVPIRLSSLLMFSMLYSSFEEVGFIGRLLDCSLCSVKESSCAREVSNELFNSGMNSG